MIKGKLKYYENGVHKNRLVKLTRSEVLELIDQTTLNAFLNDFSPTDKKNAYINSLNTLNKICEVVINNIMIEAILLIGSFLNEGTDYADIDIFIITTQKIENAKGMIISLINSSKIFNVESKQYDIITMSGDEFFYSLLNNDYKVITTFLTGKFLYKKDYWYLTRERMKNVEFSETINIRLSNAIKYQADEMIYAFEKNLKHLYFYNLYEGTLKYIHGFLLQNNITDFNKDLILENLESLAEKSNDDELIEIIKLYSKLLKVKNIRLNSEMTLDDIDKILAGYKIAKKLISKINLKDK